MNIHNNGVFGNSPDDPHFALSHPNAGKQPYQQVMEKPPIPFGEQTAVVVVRALEKAVDSGLNPFTTSSAKGYQLIDHRSRFRSRRVWRGVSECRNGSASVHLTPFDPFAMNKPSRGDLPGRSCWASDPCRHTASHRAGNPLVIHL
jgi:hypothetical protein